MVLGMRRMDDPVYWLQASGFRLQEPGRLLPMRKILLLHTGGTLGMAPSGEPASLAPGPFLEHLLMQVPELGQLAVLSVEVPFNQDSAALEPAHILTFTHRVREAAAAFDGFVIIRSEEHTSE